MNLISAIGLTFSVLGLVVLFIMERAYKEHLKAQKELIDLLEERVRVQEEIIQEKDSDLVTYQKLSSLYDKIFTDLEINIKTHYMEDF